MVVFKKNGINTRKIKIIYTHPSRIVIKARV